MSNRGRLTRATLLRKSVGAATGSTLTTRTPMSLLPKKLELRSLGVREGQDGDETLVSTSAEPPGAVTLTTERASPSSHLAPRS